jgi:hypothetical protein
MERNLAIRVQNSKLETQNHTFYSRIQMITMFSALDDGRRDEMNDSIAINISAASLINVLKRELGDAQNLFLLSTCHTSDTPESRILFEARRKLLKLEKTKIAEKARIKNIGDFDAVPDE